MVQSAINRNTGNFPFKHFIPLFKDSLRNVMNMHMFTDAAGVRALLYWPLSYHACTHTHTHTHTHTYHGKCSAVQFIHLWIKSRPSLQLPISNLNVPLDQGGTSHTVITSGDSKKKNHKAFPFSSFQGKIEPKPTTVHIWELNKVKHFTISTL